MKILVTGSNGYVGGFISRHLSKIHTVLTPTSKELDLRNLTQVSEWFDQNQVDVVVHCALTGREQLFSTEPQFLSDGLLMFRNLWVNKHHYAKFINLGTAYEFDLNVDNSNVYEESFVDHLPITSYGYSKNIIARIISDTENFYNLRLFGVFHETESSLRFFQRVKHQSEVIISNDQYIDYIYLPDIFPMIDCIIDNRSQHKDINMVYLTKYRLSQLALYLCDQLNLSKDKIVVTGNNGNNLTGNPSRLASYGFNLVGIHKGLENYK
jgi:dTDP-4-dehydrorhamnose reductase